MTQVFEKRQGRVRNKGKIEDDWIQDEGTLGEGFLTTMTKAQREKAMDKAVKRYGYRSTLGKVMVLNRNSMIRRKYGSKISASKDYLKKKYGGPGSFGPEKKAKKSRRKSNPLKNSLSSNASLRSLKTRLLR